MAQEPTGMVECHVSGKVFVKKLKTKPRRRNRPRGLFFYLPYTFTGSQQNELYLNTLVLLILISLFSCHRVITVCTARGQTFYNYLIINYYIEGVAAATPNYSSILILRLPLQLLHLQQLLRLRLEEQQSQHCRMSEPEWLLPDPRCCLQQPSCRQR